MRAVWVLQNIWQLVLSIFEKSWIEDCIRHGTEWSGFGLNWIGFELNRIRIEYNCIGFELIQGSKALKGFLEKENKHDKVWLNLWLYCSF